jgi:hypothetical protein
MNFFYGYIYTKLLIARLDEGLTLADYAKINSSFILDIPP